MEINLIQGHSQHVCVRVAGISGFICLTPPGFCHHPHSTHSERNSRQRWWKSDTLCPLSSLFNFKELPLHSYLYCRQIHELPPTFIFFLIKRGLVHHRVSLSPIRSTLIFPVSLHCTGLAKSQTIKFISLLFLRLKMAHSNRSMPRSKQPSSLNWGTRVTRWFVASQIIRTSKTWTLQIP